MSGPTEFDPYQKWLGIPPSEQPPDHYCLLGLERFEEDRAVIQQHVNQRMLQLSKHKEGPFAKVCKELFYKISVAKACLLNPSLKPGYDRQLQDKLARGKTRTDNAARESGTGEERTQSEASAPRRSGVPSATFAPRKATPVPRNSRVVRALPLGAEKPSSMVKTKRPPTAKPTADRLKTMESLLGAIPEDSGRVSEESLFGPQEATPVKVPTVERLKVPTADPVATEDREPPADRAENQTPRGVTAITARKAATAVQRASTASGQATADEPESSPNGFASEPEPEPSLAPQSAEVQIPRFAGYELLPADDPAGPLPENPGYQVVAPHEAVTREATGPGKGFRSKLVIGVAIAASLMVAGLFLWEWATRPKSSAFGQAPVLADRTKGTPRPPTPPPPDPDPAKAAKAAVPSASARRAEQPAAAMAGDAVEIGVAYGTEKRTWLEWAVREFANSEDGSRIRVNLIPMGSVEGARAVVEGDTHIHVWSPASKLYKEAFVRDWDAKYKGNPILREDVLALTPMVFVMWKSRYDEFLKKSPEVSLKTIAFAMRAKTGWATIAGKPEWGLFKFGLTDPNQSNSGLMTLILLAYEYSQKTSGLIGDEIRAPKFLDYMSTLERGVTGLSNSTGNLMAEMVVKGPSSYDVLMVYESVVIDSIQNAETRWGDLRVIYPKFTLWNDNPYYILNTPWTTPAHQKAADAFLKFLMSEPIQLRALRHGFRPGNPSVSLKRPDSPFVRYDKIGLNIDLPSVCDLPSVEVIENLQQAWARFAVPR